MKNVHNEYFFAIIKMILMMRATMFVWLRRKITFVSHKWDKTFQEKLKKKNHNKFFFALSSEIYERQFSLAYIYCCAIDFYEY